MGRTGAQEGDDDAGNGGDEGDPEAVLNGLLVLEGREDLGVVVQVKTDAGIAVKSETVHDQHDQRKQFVHDDQKKEGDQCQQIIIPVVPAGQHRSFVFLLHRRPPSEK